MFLFISVTEGGNVNEALVFLWQEYSPRKELKNHTLGGSEPQGEVGRSPHDLPQV